jgi:two-component system sensor kinase FixL
MPKTSRKSSRHRSSNTPPNKVQELAPEPTLSSKAEQVIAVSQARRRQLRANVAALTHLLFKNFHLTTAVHQLNISRRLQPDTPRSSSNQQLFGDVGASILNEISQPLTAILSNLGAASHLLGAESLELSEILADVRVDTLRACGVVRDMRELFQGNISRKTLLPANAIVENLVQTLSAEARQRHTSLMADLSADLPEVYADGAQIEQAVTNLIWNGIDAMDGTHPQERAVLVSTRYLDGSVVEISVSDQGNGISPDALPHLFDTYFTTKPDRMGLGLAVARSIAGLHQGTITAENNPGKGATFRLRLPIRHVDDAITTGIHAVS